MEIGDDKYLAVHGKFEINMHVMELSIVMSRAGGMLLIYKHDAQGPKCGNSPSTCVIIPAVHVLLHCG